MTKQFPLRVVLTVSTGRLLTQRKGPHDNGISDLYDILNWLTGDNLFTHQLPRAGDACKPWLLKCFPELAGANEFVSLLDCHTWQDADEAVERWLTQLKNSLPDLKESYDVEPMPDGWVSMDPSLELESMIGKNRIITVKP